MKCTLVAGTITLVTFMNFLAGSLDKINEAKSQDHCEANNSLEYCLNVKLNN